MRKFVIFKKSLLLLMVFLFLLTGCGKENPPIVYAPEFHIDGSGSSNDNSSVNDDGIPENNGNSKPIDEYPCEGIHVTAEANAFWKDTEVSFKPIDDSTENIEKVDHKLYDEEGALILAGFEVEAGLADDEYMPGQFDVEFDLSTTEIDPDYYEYLKVYRVGDNGDYYELNCNVDGNILKFSSDQNSVFLTCLVVEALAAICVTGFDEYLGRNVYFVKSSSEILSHDGKNIFGSWRIEWAIDDIDPDFSEKLKKMNVIERKYIREAEKKYREDEMYFATNQMVLNQMMCDYIVKGIEADKEHKKIRDQIEFPDTIREIDKCIDNAFRYLYQEEKMRMPLYRVPFKLIKDEDKYYGKAVNRALSNPYVDINLNYVDPKRKEDMYNLQMTLAHELLHVCQVRYRLPIDAISDNTRYDEMVAQMMEADALAYFNRKGIIPESANLDLTRYDYWGNLRLPINGEEDSKLNDDVKQDEIINCGYNLGSFLRYLIDKEGKRPNCHTIMKARKYLTSGTISGPLCDVFGIDERAFDLHFRNWIISNRSNIARMAHEIVSEKNKYGLEQPIYVKKGEKYHRDFIHSSYFLNIRTFEISKTEKNARMILVPDENLRDVFPSSNVGTGLDYKSITAGQYFDKFVLFSNAAEYVYLPVLEVQGDGSGNDAAKNAGYTVYVLDKTPKPELELSDEKLIIKMPNPDLIVADGIADGYIVTLTTDNGLKKAKEITKDNFGKNADISRNALYNGNPDKDVKVTVTLNEFFYDGDKNRIMGIESDEVSIVIPKMEKSEQKPSEAVEESPAKKDDGNGNTEKVPESGGYWKLKETNVTATKDEIGEDGYASWYYSASETSHSIHVSRPATKTHGAGSADFVVTCTQAPKIIVPGEDVVMSVSIDMSYSGDYLLWTASGSVRYGEPNDERNAIKYNAGIKFEATTENGKDSAYLDTIGNTPCPKIEVKHAFEKGRRSGQEMAILFYGSSNTLWIYEWVEN